MRISRRRALRSVGASISGTIVAGCLSETGDDGNGDGADDPVNGDDDVDPTIGVRVRNETPDSRRFDLTIRDDEGTVVAEDELTVAANSVTVVPTLGRSGEPRTIEASVDGGTTVSETFEFDVEGTPELADGYVDITYSIDDMVTIVFAPIDDLDGSVAIPGVDIPPYDIDEPSCTGDGDRDPLWLCENMDDEPTTRFEQTATSGSVLRDEGLRLDVDGSEPQFYGTILTDDDDFDRLVDDEGTPVDLIDGTDFDTEAVLVVQTGWGSGTVTPHLKRIEITRDGIHAFGCYRRPCGGTADFTSRTAVARFERPVSLESGIVTLTVDPETRVTFRTGDGVVTIADELDGSSGDESVDDLPSSTIGRSDRYRRFR